MNEARCTDSRLGELTAALALGGLSSRDQQRVEAHLLECDACWEDVQRLEATVSVLRGDRERVRAMVLRDINVLMGPSSRFHTWLAGERRFAFGVTGIYALLFGLALVVEVAYAIADLGPATWVAGGVSAGIGAASMLGALTMDWMRCHRGFRGGTAMSAAILIVGLLAAAGLGTWWLPNMPLVKATFTTYPAPLGYAKTLFWTILPALIVVIVPFGAVLTLLREAGAGRHRGVLLLLTRSPLATPPRGMLFLPPLAALVTGGLLVLHDYVGMSNVFDALIHTPEMSLFMTLRFMRLVALCVLVAVSFVWYMRALAEIKREAIAAAAHAQQPQRTH